MAVLLLLILVVALPALIALSFENGRLRFGRHGFLRRLRAGAPIVYCTHESSTCPTRDARDVHPAEHGDFYYYTINNIGGSKGAPGTDRSWPALRDGTPIYGQTIRICARLACRALRYGARFPYLA